MTEFEYAIEEVRIKSITSREELKKLISKYRRLADTEALTKTDVMLFHMRPNSYERLKQLVPYYKLYQVAFNKYIHEGYPITDLPRYAQSGTFEVNVRLDFMRAFKLLQTNLEDGDN